MNPIDLSRYAVLERLLTVKYFNDGWLQPIVGSCDEQLESKISNNFPYQPLKKNYNAKVSFDTSYTPNMEWNQNPEIQGSQDKPLYLIQMPWVPPKQKDENYQNLITDPNLFSTGIKKLKFIVDCIARQTFGSISSVSRTQAKKRVAVVIGMNRVYSPDKNFNGEFRDFLASIPQMEQVSLRIMGFLWSPWVKKYSNEMVLRGQRGHASWIYPIDQAYLLVKRLCHDRPNVVVTLEKVLEVERQFHSNYRPKEKFIPYQKIRDRIMKSDEMKSLFDFFRSQAPATPIYLTTMDPDFYSLKRRHQGLFSRYDGEIAKYHDANNASLTVASTGYRAPAKAPSIIKFGIYLDMLIRTEMTKILGSSAYYLEPNFAALIPAGKQPRDFSFEKKRGTKTNDAESRWFVKNAIRSGLINPQHMRFFSSGAIITDIDEDWKRKTYNELPRITQRTIKRKEVLQSLRSVKQSHVNPQVWANNVYHAIDVDFKKDRMKGIALLKKIHDAYSPIVWTKDLRELTRLRDKCFDETVRFFPYYLQCLDVVLQDPSSKDSQAQSFASQLSLVSRGEQEVGKQLFRGRYDEITAAKQKLMAFGYSNDHIETVIQLAKVTGATVHKGIQNVDVREVDGLRLVDRVIQQVRIRSWEGLCKISKEEAYQLARKGNLKNYVAIDHPSGHTIARKPS